MDGIAPNDHACSNALVADRQHRAVLPGLLQPRLAVRGLGGVEDVRDAVAGQRVTQFMGAGRLLLGDDPHRGQGRGGVMSRLPEQFADRPVEFLVPPSAGSGQVGVDHPVGYRAQDSRGRLSVLHQRHGNTHAGRGRAAPRDHEHPLGSRCDAAGLSEELRGGRRRHRRGRHHQRHLAASGPQFPEAAERRCGRGIADDQVILAVPAAQRAIEYAEALRIIVDHHQHRNCHRLVLTSMPDAGTTHQGTE
jgi:hypothetical protein